MLAPGKPVQNLTVEDLRETPIWEFSGGSAPNDGVVRPRPDLTVHDVSVGSGAFAVLTDFVLADGKQMTGYSSPGDWPPPFLGYLQPAILTPAGQVPFWFSLDEDPGPRFAATYYEMLDRTAGAVFPVRFSIPVSLAAGPSSGVIEGFAGLVYDRGEFREFRLG